MVLNDNGGFDMFDKVNNVTCLVQKMMDITTQTIQNNELINYHILFISCSTPLSNTARFFMLFDQKLLSLPVTFDVLRLFKSPTLCPHSPLPPLWC